MTATREHRNAGRIEEAVDEIGEAITRVRDLYDELAAHLPDDFPALRSLDGEGALDRVESMYTKLAQEVSA